jgi:cytochrome b561
MGGVWYESWYLKALIELGVVGLAVFLVLIARLLVRAARAHRATVADPEARSMSAAFLALFIWTLLFSIKTAGIDEDPLDLYVWLFLGWQWRLGDMVAPSASSRAP